MLEKPGNLHWRGKNYHSLFRPNLLITEVFCKLSLVSGTQNTRLLGTHRSSGRHKKWIVSVWKPASTETNIILLVCLTLSISFEKTYEEYMLASSGFVFLSVSSPLWSCILIPWYNSLFQDLLMSIVPSTELNCLK